MFDQLVVSSATPSKTNKNWAIAVSAMGQTVLLGMLILVPLIYTEALPNAMLKTLIIAPPPPSPPPPPTNSTKRRESHSSDSFESNYVAAIDSVENIGRNGRSPGCLY